MLYYLYGSIFSGIHQSLFGIHFFYNFLYKLLVYVIQMSFISFCRSKIIFKTAGVLLEEMKEKGLNALKYKVIILDEVHERSIESDLVLVCVKQFLLKNNDLRYYCYLSGF